jgi:hypothetical protein
MWVMFHNALFRTKETESFHNQKNGLQKETFGVRFIRTTVSFKHLKCILEIVKHKNTTKKKNNK